MPCAPSIIYIFSNLVQPSEYTYDSAPIFPWDITDEEGAVYTFEGVDPEIAEIINEENEYRGNYL